MMATVPHVTSGLGLRKFQADGFLLTRVYLLIPGTEMMMMMMMMMMMIIIIIITTKWAWPRNIFCFIYNPLFSYSFI